MARYVGERQPISTYGGVYRRKLFCDPTAKHEDRPVRLAGHPHGPVTRGGAFSGWRLAVQALGSATGRQTGTRIVAHSLPWRFKGDPGQLEGVQAAHDTEPDRAAFRRRTGLSSAASLVIAGGTSPPVGAIERAAAIFAEVTDTSGSARRRHRCTRLVLRLCDNAMAATDAPGRTHSARTRAFRALL